MTDEKKVGGKLTDEQLGLGLDALEKRSVVERGAQKKKPRQPVKEAAAKLIQKALPKTETPKKAAPKSPEKQGKGAAGTQNEKQDAPQKQQKQPKQGAKQQAGKQQPPKQQAPKEPNRKQAPKQQAAQKSAASGQQAPKAPKKPSRGGKKAPVVVGATIELSEPGKARQAAEARQDAGKQQGRRRKGQKEQRKTPVRVIPLGGLLEVGKNVTVYECMDDMFLVDCGMTFPDENMLGVDLVLPDFTYVMKNRDKVRGIVITHGHEDHIGALAYFLKQLNVPVYATRLTLGLIENKLREHGLYGKVKLVQIAPQETIKLGCFEVEFIRVNHSIPDAVALAIHTPAGVIIQTGDFKIDYTPIIGDIIDLARFGELGGKGVLALLSDSTNAERPGFTPTEVTVAESFDKLFKQAEHKRIIVATFSSNIHRMQLVCEAAAKYGRKVAVSGRSMVNTVLVSTELPQAPRGGHDRHRRHQPLPSRGRRPHHDGQPGRADERAFAHGVGRSPQGVGHRERFHHHQREPHPRQRKDGRPRRQRPDAAGRRRDLRADVRGARLGPRLPGGAENHARAHQAEVLLPGARRV